MILILFLGAKSKYVSRLELDNQQLKEKLNECDYAYNMNAKEKKILKRLEDYTKEIIYPKPSFDTVFRKYYDTLIQVNNILYALRENPIHPENDYADQILMDIDDAFEELERIKNI